jgi:glycosyltransferase involved in cell wall biosynthesis
MAMIWAMIEEESDPEMLAGVAKGRMKSKREQLVESLEGRLNEIGDPMNAFGQSLCLNMIVKDEAPVIRRCLDSVRPIIDCWVIVDTGSTDGTQEIIRDHLKDLPGELHERRWENFAHNRTEALTLARGRGDYVFVIDADEVLEIEPGFVMPQLTADSYNMLINYGGCSYLRKQLVRNTLPWRYEGVLHEYITCEHARTGEFLSGLQTKPHHDGARARDATTYRRDALVLEQALLGEPNNTRYVFYLAQSYRDGGDLELALRNYKRRVELGGWPEEVWYSLYQVAQLKERMQHPWPEVMESYLAAWQYQPDRAGALYRIAMHYQAKGEYHISHMYLSRAMKAPPPAPNRLFVERTIYDYQLPLEYAVACYYVGQHTEAIAVNNALLRSGRLPPDVIDQVIRNRRFSVDALFPKTESSQTDPRLRVLVPFHDPGPEFDDCVESLYRQEGDFFQVIFLDDGSGSDQAAKLPLGDPRFTLQRFDRTEGARNRIARHVRDDCGPEEIVVALLPGNRLADAETLKHVRELFQDGDCLLAYGQFRTASCDLGSAEPAPSEEVFLNPGGDFAARATVAFRAHLLQQAAGDDTTMDWRGLFHAASFAHTRFSDAVWTVEQNQASAETARSARPAAPATPTGRLPSISCLMVTLDRLALAKRAILCYSAQTYPEKELVIVTDGEERFSRALERYVAALGLSRVRFVYPSRERLTLGQLRNISMDAAGGDIICQWDDDDYNHPDRLMTQAEHMIRQGAGACFLSDHLQFIEEKRVLCWVDWTLGGTSQGSAQLAPGTLMMRRDPRYRYPEEGPFARQGEDSVLLEALCRSMSVANLTGAGYLYLYQYHGRNTFSREHHYRLSNCCASIAYLNENADKLREAVRHYPIAKPCFVIGRDGPAFAMN